MSWRTVVVLKHCKISIKMGLLVFQTDDDIISIPLSDIGLLLITSTRSVITTRAIAELSKRDIKIIFCDEKALPIAQNIPLQSNAICRDRILQQMSWEESRKNALWQQIIREKIRLQYQTLVRCACDSAQDMYHLIEEVEPGDPTNREAVASHMYFPRLFSYEFTRSDDENSLNSLLNYGYSIILSDVSRNITACGYLNQVGIHHDNNHNSYNLACDFMEPFRPFVDERVFHLGHTELTTTVKLKLISYLRQDNEILGTTLAKCITGFVRECFQYLKGEEKLPCVCNCINKDYSLEFI